MLTIPIQALAVRSQKELEEAEQDVSGKRDSGRFEAMPRSAGQKQICREFSWCAREAVFVPVQTGITGVTDIEVTSGLQEGDQLLPAATKHCGR